jgi:hypothetical protein
MKNKLFLPSAIILLLMFIWDSKPLLAQEIPVIAQAQTKAKVLFLVDDSWSMFWGILHPDYVNLKKSEPSWIGDLRLGIPGIIFRVDSGSASPNPTHPAHPVFLGEFEPIWNDIKEFKPNFSFGTLKDSWFVQRFSCSDTNLCKTGDADLFNHWASPRNFGSDGRGLGPQAFMHFFIPFITGIEPASNPLFDIDSLHRTSDSAAGVQANSTLSGSYFTGPNGEEYLYTNFRNDSCRVAANLKGSAPLKSSSLTTSLLLDDNQPPNNWNCYDHINRDRYFSVGTWLNFRGKRFYLAEGRYPADYMRWIFWYATQSQLDSLPRQNRMQAVKDAIKEIIDRTPGTEFAVDGLNRHRKDMEAYSGNITGNSWGWFYTEDPIFWWSPVGGGIADGNNRDDAFWMTAPFSISANVKDAVDQMVPFSSSDSMTPITRAYVRAANYMINGDAARSLPAPMDDECTNFSIVLLTDGLPETDSARRLNGEWPMDYDGDGEETFPFETCSNDQCVEYLDDISYHLYQSDLRPDVVGTQNIRTSVINFDFSSSHYDRIAAKGGSRTAAKVNSYDEIIKAMESAVSQVISSSITGSSINLHESVTEDGTIVRAKFRADEWSGHLDFFTLDQQGIPQFQFDAAKKLEVQNSRKVLTAVDDGHGNMNIIPFAKGNRAILHPLLLTAGTPKLETPLVPYNSVGSAEALIDFINGEEISGLRVRDRDNDDGRADLGDIVFSSPVEVGARSGNYLQFNNYVDFLIEERSKKVLILVGANDGMLHAFDKTSGEEEWAFIPPSLLSQLHILSRLDYNSKHRRSFVDGQITVHDVYLRNLSKWRKIVIFGLRSGGSEYIGLDITDRSNPEFLFSISAPNELGISSSKPAVVNVQIGNGNSSDPDDYFWYSVFASAKAKNFSRIGILDLNELNNPLIFKNLLPTQVPTVSGYSTSVVAINSDKDLSIDRLYVGNTTGDLYRVEVGQREAVNWEVKRLFNGSEKRPISAPPTAILVDIPGASEELAVGVYFGTGRFDSLADRVYADPSNTTYPEQEYYGIFDPVDFENDDYAEALSDITRDHLDDQTPGASFNVIQNSINKAFYFADETKKGFRITLAKEITLSDNYLNPVGMIVASATNNTGLLLVPSFLPISSSSGACMIAGHSFLNGFNFRTGGGVIGDYVSTRLPFFNGGITDLDNDGDKTRTDLELGIATKKLQVSLDAKVESILPNQLFPYEFDDALLANDVRLNSSGGVEAAVISLGNTGVPTGPTIAFGAARVYTQSSFIKPADPVHPPGGHCPPPPPPPAPEGAPDSSKIGILQRSPQMLTYHRVTE